MVVLIPGQSAHSLGGELIGVGVVAWIVLLAVQARTITRLRSWSERQGAQQGSSNHEKTQWALQQLSIGQRVTLPTILAGATLIAQSGGGLYWLAVGTGFALVAGVTDAWVLLIEIMR